MTLAGFRGHEFLSFFGIYEIFGEAENLMFMICGYQNFRRSRKFIVSTKFGKNYVLRHLTPHSICSKYMHTGNDGIVLGSWHST